MTSPAFTPSPSPGAGVRDIVIGFFWLSIMAAMIKHVGARLPHMEIIFCRSAASMGLCLFFLRRARVSCWGCNRRVLLLRGVFGFLAVSCGFYAVINAPLADTFALMRTNTIFAAILSYFIYGERLGARGAACVAAGLVGVGLMARPTFLFGGIDPLPPLAVAAALAGAFFVACSLITLHKLGKGGEHPLVSVFYFNLIAGPLALLVAIPGWVWPTPAEWALFAAIGGLSLLGQFMVTRGLASVPAARASILSYLSILYAAFWSMVLFDEYPDAFTISGAAVIIISTAAMTGTLGKARDKLKHKRQ